ncbi:hypothetical protein ACOSP7_021010 [Xanthoceras sorbifolium]
MTKPQVLLDRSTYNQLVKPRTAPHDAQVADEEMDMEQEQDLGQQEAVPLERGQLQAQPMHDDRILAATAEMQASFEGRMELIGARINSRLDVMEVGMIDLGDQMNTMGRKIDKIETAVIQHYSRRRSRTPPQPPSR